MGQPGSHKYLEFQDKGQASRPIDGQKNKMMIDEFGVLRQQICSPINGQKDKMMIDEPEV